MNIFAKDIKELTDAELDIRIEATEDAIRMNSEETSEDFILLKEDKQMLKELSTEFVWRQR